jgi:hypothetical protein
MSAKVQGPDASPGSESERRRDLPPAAPRALEEAETRQARSKPAAPREFNGPRRP